MQRSEKSKREVQRDEQIIMSAAITSSKYGTKYELRLLNICLILQPCLSLFLKKQNLPALALHKKMNCNFEH